MKKRVLKPAFSLPARSTKCSFPTWTAGLELLKQPSIFEGKWHSLP
jgi:hypothetical protein